MSKYIAFGIITGTVILGTLLLNSPDVESKPKLENAIDMDRKQRRKWMRQQDPNSKLRNSYCGEGYHPVFRKESGVMKIHCRKD